MKQWIAPIILKRIQEGQKRKMSTMKMILIQVNVVGPLKYPVLILAKKILVKHQSNNRYSENIPYAKKKKLFTYSINFFYLLHFYFFCLFVFAF